MRSVAQVPIVLRKYMMNEIHYAVCNMVNAKTDIQNSMRSLAETVKGYGIEINNFREVLGKANAYLRGSEQFENNVNENNVCGAKKLTAHLEIVTEEIKTIVKTFPHRQKRLIDEAAQRRNEVVTEEDVRRSIAAG
ncbi:hypothetical protein GCK72_023713 [Caenorhabditis remanei]|uniref:Uncharacterized protein n=1 Tax=Caenorhabditis remanei TaxID=31234 RepID=A0A6A5FXX3_CAERE|nr:hypothetical protein GCK72_023713 [Caenorhabditis remanei]KAF1747251.1 hypothetical protein GCK72_023713 [Caenorhabditis remanei]